MFIQLGIIAFIAFRGSNGQESCSTTSGARGTCVSITQCKPIFALLNKPGTLDTSERGILQKAGCGVTGNTPKVCCPTNPEEVPTSPGNEDVPNPPDVSNHRNLRLINAENCGPITDSRIIHGNKTTVLEFPWMALIGYTRTGQEGVDYGCGGTVINKRWILTAAHCVVDLPSGRELFGVRIGEHNLNTERDCDLEEGEETICADKHQDFSIETFHAPSNYRSPINGDDIALIKIDKDADFTRQNVRPICLPVETIADPALKKGTVTGWGRTENHVPSPVLLKVRLTIVPTDSCADTFRRSEIAIGYKQLCAGGRNRYDSCAGDSGGPLQNPGNINGVPKYIQHGVVSFGTASCGVDGYPGVYTKVTEYMGWILDNITE